MEETKTEFILTASDKKIYDKMLQLQKMPLKMQQFMYHRDDMLKFYGARVIVDGPEKITVMDKQFNLRMGPNGVFIKQGNNLTAVTYKKTGRSSSRLTQWGKGRENNGFLKMELIKTVANVVNPDVMGLLEDKVICKIGTKGMIGAILNNKIKNKEEAMKYYIRYSMRGVGISQDMWEGLYNYFNAMDSHLDSSLLLRVSTDVNSFLDICRSNPHATRIIINKMDKHTTRDIVKKSLAVGDTIDWSDMGLKLNELEAKLKSKISKYNDYVDIWSSGPTIKRSKGDLSEYQDDNFPF